MLSVLLSVSLVDNSVEDRTYCGEVVKVFKATAQNDAEHFVVLLHDQDKNEHFEFIVSNSEAHTTFKGSKRCYEEIEKRRK